MRDFTVRLLGLTLLGLVLLFMLHAVVEFRRRYLERRKFQDDMRAKFAADNERRRRARNHGVQ